MDFKMYVEFSKAHSVIKVWKAGGWEVLVIYCVALRSESKIYKLQGIYS